ncbi:hypothetical protein P3S67_018131 [Capsicum chacoense]
MSNSNLFGSIPFEIGNASYLQLLDLSSNHFSGKIPRSLDSLKLLFELDCSGNELSGDIPSQRGMLSALSKLNLAENHLSGIILEHIGHLVQLLGLNLSKNMLKENIPSNAMNLSHNKFIGSIPSSFNQCISLSFVDISNYQLIGRLPNNLAFQRASLEELRGNKGLCGHLIVLEPCSSSKITYKRIKISTIFYIFGGVLLLMVIISLLFAISQKRRNQIEQREQKKDLFSIRSFDGQMTYESIIIEIEGFNRKYCIGNGGQGRVFRVELPCGQAVVLYGFCSHARHSFLVYKFLEGGSLPERLRNDEKVTELDWIKGWHMYYLICIMNVHLLFFTGIRIKSKNVLLDHEDRPHLSDFGTAKLLRPNSSNWTSFAGTFGYVAPSMLCLSFMFSHS